MAVVFTEGFDAYNGAGINTGLQGRWNANGTTGGFAMVAGRFGGQAFQNLFNDSPGNVLITLPSGYSSFAVGYAYFGNYPTSTGAVPSNVGSTAYQITMLATGGSVYMLGARVNNNGAIEVFRATGAAAGTILGTSANGVVAASAWCFIEHEVVISDTVGTWVVKVNGTSVLSLTGQDTRNGTPTTIDAIRIGHHGTFTGCPLAKIDDMYSTDSAAALGECKVETIRPSADTAQKNWSASTGVVNYAMVDETLIDITDYVFDGTLNDYDLYDLGNLSTTPATVHAVQINMVGSKTDANTKAINLVVNDGADSVGSNVALGSTPTILPPRLLPLRPGGAAWTYTDVNALKVGPKVAV